MRGEVVQVCSCVVCYSSVEARNGHFTGDVVKVLHLHNYSHCCLCLATDEEIRTWLFLLHNRVRPTTRSGRPINLVWDPLGPLTFKLDGQSNNMSKCPSLCVSAECSVAVTVNRRHLSIWLTEKYGGQTTDSLFLYLEFPISLLSIN